MALFFMFSPKLILAYTVFRHPAARHFFCGAAIISTSHTLTRQCFHLVQYMQTPSVSIGCMFLTHIVAFYSKKIFGHYKYNMYICNRCIKINVIYISLKHNYL